MNKPSVQSKPLWDAILGMTAYPAIVVAYDLKIFNLLEYQPRTMEEFKNELNIHPRPLEAILSVNTSLGLIEYHDNKFNLTSLAREYLLDNSPFSIKGILSMLRDNPFTTSIDGLKKAVQTNTAPTYGGDDVFKSHEVQATRAKEFTRAMHSISMAPALFWPDMVDLSQHHSMLDIGGGSGAHSIGMLNRWDHMHSTVFDLAPVCEVCEEYIQQHDLSSRMHCIQGDMWNSQFPDTDVHFYSNIFHDWPYDKCQQLSRKSHESLPSGGKIIVHETLLNNDKMGPFPASAASIGMLRWTKGGVQYSRNEISQILSSTGFKNITINDTGYNYFSVVVAEK